MHESTRTVEITLLTDSLGPQRTTAVSIPLPDDAELPPLVLEDPTPDLPGTWRRVSSGADALTYIRIPRTAAP